MRTTNQSRPANRPEPQRSTAIQKRPAPSMKVKYTTAAGAEIELSKDIVKSYLVSGNPSAVSDEEVAMYIRLCQYNGLNPFLKEAYLIKYGSQPAQMITSKDVFVKRAYMNPGYDGMEAGVVVMKKDGSLEYRNGELILPNEKCVGGWCDVYFKDRGHPLRATVGLDEYSTGKSTWQKMPGTMIRKVAVAHALREAFPQDLSGLYISDEMEKATDKEISVPVADITEVAEEHTRKPEPIEAEIVEDDDAEAEDLFR